MTDQNPSTSRPRVALLTLGCAKNLVDSEQIASLLEAAGVEVTTELAGARVAIVNTCGFITPAKQESIDTILDVVEGKEGSELGTVIVAGCLAKRYGDELRGEMPEVDVFAGIDPVETARAALAALGRDAAAVAGPCLARTRRLTPDAWAYLRIADGCDNRCAYCAIPGIRGPLVSRPMDEVLDEARALVDSGVREINVIAQDTTAYGMDRGAQELPALLVRLCEIARGRCRIRLLYTHPAHYTDELIDVLAREPEMCPYVDMPLQHISDSVLARMGRKVTRAEVEDLLGRLRARIPGLTIRTTFLVGFPGETDGDFAELLDFVRTQRFERVGAFAYSPEEDTRAADFPDQVPEDVKEDRRHALMTAQREIAFELAAGRVGERADVLIEQAAGDGGRAAGRSRSEAPDVDPVIFVETDSPLQPGDVIDVEITAGEGYDCVARPAAVPRGWREQAATACGLGHLPVAPGTWGSLGAAAVFGLVLTALPGAVGTGVILAALLAAMWTGLLLGPWTERRWGRKDPGAFVLDEVAGLWLACLLAPPAQAWVVALAAFVAFRVFDILKPPPIRSIERLPAGWGVMMDDLLAGVYAAGVLWVVAVGLYYHKMAEYVQDAPGL